MATISVKDQNFEQDVLKSSKPVLVDFWAEWCGPCKMVAPILEELSNDMADQLTIAKVDIDENPLSPTKYGVRSIPTMMLFKNGDVAATKIGALSKNDLVEWLESAL